MIAFARSTSLTPGSCTSSWSGALLRDARLGDAELVDAALDRLRAPARRTSSRELVWRCSASW